MKPAVELAALRCSVRLVPPAPKDEHDAQGPPLSEDELVAGLSNNDADVQARVYRLYRREVWRVLVRVLGADHEIEDLHQEVFVYAFRGAASFRGEATLKTWLSRIAINRARKTIRSRRRRWWLRFMPSGQLPETGTASPNDEAAAQARAVYELLGQMSADEQVVFTLRFIDGRTIDEIASMMEVSAGTVKRRLRRARQRFTAMAKRHPALSALVTEGGKA